jgi:hypothetical protein
MGAASVRGGLNRFNAALCKNVPGSYHGGPKACY